MPRYIAIILIAVGAACVCFCRRKAPLQANAESSTEFQKHLIGSRTERSHRSIADYSLVSLQDLDTAETLDEIERINRQVDSLEEGSELLVQGAINDDENRELADIKKQLEKLRDVDVQRLYERTQVNSSEGVKTKRLRHRIKKLLKSLADRQAPRSTPLIRPQSSVPGRREILSPIPPVLPGPRPRTIAPPTRIPTPSITAPQPLSTRVFTSAQGQAPQVLRPQVCNISTTQSAPSFHVGYILKPTRTRYRMRTFPATQPRSGLGRVFNVFGLIDVFQNTYWVPEQEYDVQPILVRSPNAQYAP